MTTMTKMDMIKALVEANAVEELKKEKDDQIKLAARLFRTLSNEKVKALYADRIAKQTPEEAIKEVTKKAAKAAKAPKAEPIIKVEEVKIEKDPRYLETKDAAGNVYKKAWVLEELDKRGFSALNALKEYRTLAGKENTVTYRRSKNTLTVKSNKTGEVVAKTICACPFIVQSFINKFAK